MWDWIFDRLKEPVIQGCLWSVLVATLSMVFYVVIRRKVLSRSISGQTEKRRGRFLALSVVAVAAFVLIRIWTSIVPPPAGQQGVRLRAFLEKLLWTFVLAGVINLLVNVVQHALTRKLAGIEKRYKIRVRVSWVGVTVFVVAAGFIWIGNVQNFGLFLGILGAGVALSLQETLVCLAGWMLFVARRPFDIGDRIEIDGRVGDVIGVSVFQTSLLEIGNWVKAEQSTGRMLIIPNSMLLRHPIYNYTKGFPFIWDELRTIVTFESDWERAEKLMLAKAELEAEKIEKEVKRQIERMQRQYAIHYEQFGPIVYTNIAENGVELTLRYLSPVRERRTLRHRISRNILHAFLEHPRIDFAYPTMRLFRNLEEGKPGTGGRSAAR